MNDEQMTILRMVSAGKVTAEEAEQLLRALKGPRTVQRPSAPETVDRGNIHIRSKGDANDE